MPHTIQLEPRHQEIIVEALLMSLEDKRQWVIRDPQKLIECQNQYADAATKILSPVKCGMRTNNLFLWIQDQIQHSPHIRDTEVAQHAMIICQSAAQNKYHIFTQKIGEISTF